MKSKWVMTILALGMVLGGCSNQYRTTGDGISDSDLLARMGEVTSAATGATQFSQLSQDTNTAIYFSEANSTGASPLGPVESVASIVDLSALGFTGGYNAYQIEYVDIFFLDGYLTGQRKFSLAVKIKFQGDASVQTVTFDSTYVEFTSRRLVVEMQSGTGRMIQLSTYDVDRHVANELGGVIQLRVSVLNSSNNQYEDIGKFSTLIGYGG